MCVYIYKTECGGKLEGRRTGGTISRIWEIIREQSWWHKGEEGPGHECVLNITSPLACCVNYILYYPATGSGMERGEREKEREVASERKTCRGRPTEQGAAVHSPFQCTAQYTIEQFLLQDVCVCVWVCKSPQPAPLPHTRARTQNLRSIFAFCLSMREHLSSLSATCRSLQTENTPASAILLGDGWDDVV